MARTPAEKRPTVVVAMVAQRVLGHRRIKATEGRRCVRVTKERVGGSKAPMSVSMSTVEGTATEPKGARESAWMSTGGGDRADGMSMSTCGAMAVAMAIHAIVAAARKYYAGTGSAWRADVLTAALQ